MNMHRALFTLYLFSVSRMYVFISQQCADTCFSPMLLLVHFSRDKFTQIIDNDDDNNDWLQLRYVVLNGILCKWISME